MGVAIAGVGRVGVAYMSWSSTRWFLARESIPSMMTHTNLTKSGTLGTYCVVQPMKWNCSTV